MLGNALELLKRYYGYTDFREGQKQAIESILNGQDTFAVMPTGAGKSICFQIPALLLGGVTLVISPLISLMKDQVDTLQSTGIPSTFINSSLTSAEVENRIQRTYNGEFKLLYVAPERLESEWFCDILKLLKISLLAVDEAHCVSQWGHDFRPSYNKIKGFINKLPKRPIIAAFTATATEEVKKDVIELLTLEEPKVIITSFDRKNLRFTVIKGENKKDFVLKYVKENKNAVGIIYASTRKEVDNIYDMLYKKGFAVGKYHAGLGDVEKNKNQENFIYDNINIIVATNAFGMGIDKSNVRYVIHYNMPKNMEAYYQEAGRAGRDGEPSECTLLFSAHDILLQKYLIEQNVVSQERKNYELNRLQNIVDYCHTSKCLRKYILQYFGEENSWERCENCSNCSDETELQDITVEAQKIFSCIVRMRERYGTTLVAEVLRGSKNKKVLQLGFDKLSTYCIMKEYTVKEIKDMINMLIADEYLRLSDGEYPLVKLQEKAVSVLKNKEKVLKRVHKKKAKVVKDDTLFESLKVLRKEIAIREGVPPYIVFQDNTLREMSNYCPLDKVSMLAIKGVGEVKLKKYGEEFLKAIKEFTVK